MSALWAGMSSILVAPYPIFPGLDIKEGFIGLFVRIAFLLFVEHDNKDKNLLRKESRAGGLVRLRGSVGGAPRGQSGGSLLTPVCHRVGLSRRLADVNGQSAGKLRRSGRLAGHLVGAWVVTGESYFMLANRRSARMEEIADFRLKCVSSYHEVQADQ